MVCETARGNEANIALLTCTWMWCCLLPVMMWVLSGLTLILPNVKLSFITFGEFKSYINLSPQFLYSLHKDEPLVFLNLTVFFFPILQINRKQEYKTKTGLNNDSKLAVGLCLSELWGSLVSCPGCISHPMTVRLKDGWKMAAKHQYRWIDIIWFGARICPALSTKQCFSTTSFPTNYLKISLSLNNSSYL